MASPSVATSSSPASSSSSCHPLTSVTAPGKVFASRSDLAEHYKSDWHRYNLKRREANVPVLLEEDFGVRLHAAQQALQQHKTNKNGKKDHLKNSNKKNKKKEQTKKTNGSSSHAATVTTRKDPAVEAYHHPSFNEPTTTTTTTTTTTSHDETHLPAVETFAVAEPVDHVLITTSNEKSSSSSSIIIEIDPCQCLFDSHVSASVQENVERMQRKYGFFIPDVEYLADRTGLIGYCSEKIRIGHTCLYCQQQFASTSACQKHSMDKHHCKIRYEEGVDLDEFEVFYNFEEANQEYLKERGVDVNDDDEDVPMNDEEWEDVSDDDELMVDDANAIADDDDDEEEEEEEEGLYNRYEDHVRQLGFGVTVLGELVLPDGRIVGHRDLRRYYKQRVRISDNNNHAAVVAARNAAGERLVHGRVVNIRSYDSNALVLRQAGVVPALADGRNGKGILVATRSGTFSQLSVYRYRAAIRKQQQGDRAGQRLQDKTKQNMNRMDKKANRLMNGVSVAHAKR